MMQIWGCVFGCFFGTFVLSALFALPISAVVLGQRVASCAASEIRC